MSIAHPRHKCKSTRPARVHNYSRLRKISIIILRKYETYHKGLESELRQASCALNCVGSRICLSRCEVKPRRTVCRLVNDTAETSPRDFTWRVIALVLCTRSPFFPPFDTVGDEETRESFGVENRPAIAASEWNASRYSCSVLMTWKGGTVGREWGGTTGKHCRAVGWMFPGESLYFSIA